MWNDEEPREPDTGLRQVASSWALVAAIAIGLAGWSAFQYAIDVVELVVTKDNAPAPHCHAAQGPGETHVVQEHDSHVDGAQRTSLYNAADCGSTSSNSFDLPGTALAVDWGSLR
jgi:hypothetical protein